MGLLDFDMNDPKTAGLLQLGLGILAGNTGRPGDLGQGIMAGAQNYQQIMQQQQRQKMLEQQQEMQNTQFDWQKQDRERAAQQRDKQAEMLGGIAQQYGIDPNVITAFPDIGQDIVKNKLVPKQAKIAFTPSGVAYDENNPNLVPGQSYSKPESKPAAIQEYEYALGQGFKGTFNDFITAQKRAGAANTTVTYGAPVAGVDASGNPVFFQPSKGGGAPAIVPGVRPKPDQPKSPTEVQAKAGTFHSQMVSASNELGTLSREGFDPSSVRTQVETSVAGGLTNPIAGEKAQRARQAQEQWSEAFLRVKTGAAATQGEVDRNIRTFFPQVGDTPEVIAQKARMRTQAESDVASMAGPAQQNAGTQPSASDLQELARQELKRRGKVK